MRLLLITLFLSLALGVGSAVAGSGGLGVQVSLSGNSLTGSLPDEGKWKGRGGLGASLLAEWSLTSDIALCFQPGVTPRNSRQEFSKRDQVIGYIDYDFDYFTLPFLVRVSGDPVGVRGFVTLGLELSLLLEATIDGGEGPIDFKDQLDEESFGALLGAGAMVPLGRNFLLFELRYVQGLDDIVDRDTLDPEQEEALSPSVKYRGLQLQIGFLITLGGG